MIYGKPFGARARELIGYALFLFKNKVNPGDQIVVNFINCNCLNHLIFLYPGYLFLIDDLIPNHNSIYDHGLHFLDINELPGNFLLKQPQFYRLQEHH